MRESLFYNLVNGKCNLIETNAIPEMLLGRFEIQDHKSFNELYNSVIWNVRDRRRCGFST